MAVRPDLYAAFYEFANELDPTIGHYLEGLHNKLVSNVMEIAPKKRNEHVKWAADTYDKMINGMMSPMQIMDILIKIQAAMAAYSQFVHGDVEGFPIEKVLAMSNNERYARAQAYVRQISRLSLTHGRPEDRAPFQKLPMMDFLSYYWNDARNGLNNEISMIRRIRGKISEGNDAMNGVGGEPPGGSGGGEPPNTGTGWAGEAIPEPKAPDWKNVGKGFGGAAGLILFTMVAQMFTRMWEDKVRGTQETPLDAGLDLKSKEGLKQAAAYMGSYAFTSPADQLLQNHPLTRPILFAASNIWSKSKVKRVDIPLTKEATDFATTAAFVSDYLQLGVSPTPAQVRALLQSISYTMLPMPINGFNHIGKLLGFDDPITRAWDSVTGTFDPAFKGRTFILDKQIGQWKDQHAEDAPKEMIASLDQIQKQINPDPVNVPRGTTNQIKFAENGGDWTKPPLSEFEWRDIMNRAPQLGLTEAGRTSKDQTQIDKALDWTNDQNAHTLRDKNVPVNEATLYGAHKLGAEKYSELHKTPANEKAKTVLGQSDYASNPEIAAHKTVGQVKKHYADRMTEASKNLTLQTSNNED